MSEARLARLEELMETMLTRQGQQLGERMVPIADAVEMLGVSDSTIRRWEAEDPSFPKRFQAHQGSPLRVFSYLELQEWIATRKRAARRARRVM